METIRIDMTEEKVDHQKLEAPIEILKKGGLVAFPTETVYGLGGDGLLMHCRRMHQRRFMLPRADLRIIL